MMTVKNKKSTWYGLIFILLCWLLIFSLAKDLTKVGSGFNRIDETNLRLREAEKKNVELKKKLVLVQTNYFKEKIVREKLNMQKPGETVVVLADAAEQETLKGGIEAEVEEPTNLMKWWSLIR